MSDQDLYYVYVDEAGDRGWSERASPVFALTAVIVKAAHDSAVRATLNGINVKLGRPATTELHWAENLTQHQQRKYVAREIAGLPVALTTVVVCKDSLRHSATALDHARMYAYTVRRLLERVSWCVDRQGGRADLRFAHVRRFKYDPLFSYLQQLQNDTNCKIAWQALKNGTRPKIEQPSQLRNLQVADAVAGAVFAAVRPDQFGDKEPCYLKAIAPKVWRGPTNRLETYGVHFIHGAGHTCSNHHVWFKEIEDIPGLRH